VGLYVVAAAKGSPGVTTSAVALAGVWPGEPILADLDPAGGDIALRYRDPAGQPLDPDRGLLSLGAAVRRGTAEVRLTDHVQQLSGGLEVLAGVSSPSQVQGLGPTWQHLAKSLRSVPGRDVIADCGRLMPGSATVPVLQSADAVLMLARPTLEGLSHLRELIRGLSDILQLGSYDAVPVCVALITSYRDARSAGNLRAILAQAGLSASVLGILAEDDKAAAAIRTGDSRRARQSLLTRSAAEIGDRLRALGRDRVESAVSPAEPLGQSWGPS
jgi:MinD-like ATPase involved in chromosome partitioning or flagellar assembly